MGYHFGFIDYIFMIFIWLSENPTKVHTRSTLIFLLEDEKVEVQFDEQPSPTSLRSTKSQV